MYEHWRSSGFANTDLDQQLKQFGIHSARDRHRHDRSYCIEATGPFAVELGYHVTLVKDATADLSAEAMHAAQRTDQRPRRRVRRRSVSKGLGPTLQALVSEA